MPLAPSSSSDRFGPRKRTRTDQFEQLRENRITIPSFHQNMHVLSFFYDKSFGLLLRGCFSRSPMKMTIKAAESEDDLRISSRERPRDNISFLPPAILRQLTSYLDPRDFFTLAQTCRFIRWRMYNHCRCNQERLYLYPQTIDGQVRLIFNQQNKEKRIWISEKVLRNAPLYYKEMIIVFNRLTTDELSVIVTLMEKLQKKVKDVRICIQKADWNVTFEEFDHFLKIVNAQGLFTTHKVVLPLKMAFYPVMGNITLFGRFDYSSQNIRHFVHYNYYLNVVDTPSQIVVNAIQRHMDGFFSLKHQTYRYEEMKEKTKLDNWLKANANSIETTIDSFQVTFSSLKQKLVVVSEVAMIHLLG